MNAVDIISKKRDGGILSDAEISYLIDGYVRGEVPDYQMAAWCMAVFFRGMAPEETAAVTRAMAASGRRADLSGIPGVKVDKHSTGGVGDTVTLAAAPVAAAAGVPIVKMSGRSLGFTGGTADKLEAIPGYRAALAFPDFVSQVARHGIAMASQAGGMCPADSLLYALRDATGTVESLPLIASSIMSKKILSGADAIVLDVKCGRGAFMKSREKAEALIHTMASLGAAAGVSVSALLTDMDVPLGTAIGNSLEVDEAVEILSGGGGRRLRALVAAIAGAMIFKGNRAGSFAEGQETAETLLASGAALSKFAECVHAQGGETDWISSRPLTPETNTATVSAWADGFIEDIEPVTLARTAMAMGGGRAKKEDAIDLSVGVKLFKEAGDAVAAGEPLLKVYAAAGQDAEAFAAEAEKAIRIGGVKKDFPLIYETVGL